MAICLLLIYSLLIYQKKILLKSIEEDEGEDSGAISNAPTTTEDPANFTLVGQTKGAQTVEITNDGGCSIPQDASVVVD